MASTPAALLFCEGQLLVVHFFLRGSEAFAELSYAERVMNQSRLLAHDLSRLRVLSFSISIDGYGAGPGQDLKRPLGLGGEALHEWAWATRSFQGMHGKHGGDTAGPDEEFAARG